jgi:hypothetical protein
MTALAVRGSMADIMVHLTIVAAFQNLTVIPT